MRAGRRQLETYLRTQHEGVKSFDQVVERDSEYWNEHLSKSQRTKGVVVRKRHALPELLPGLEAIYDIKVGLPGRPDDAVYLESPYARRWLPRGNCIAKWKRQNTTYFFPLVRGYKKFTGQEDGAELNKHKESAEGELSKFFIKPRAQSRWMISTTKENGEAGHLAVLKRSDGKFIYVLGSKNTHLLAQNVEDVDRARMQERSDNSDPFVAAAPIATAILRLLFALKPADRTLLCEFLWQTRATASFEVLCPSHQHVQLHENIVEDTPVFYGLSVMTLEVAAGAEICVNPVLLYEFMRALGIRTVSNDIKKFDADVFANMLERSTRAYRQEGSVYLFLDDKADVIGMEKCKSLWYVCLRAIREKAKALCRAIRLADDVSCRVRKLDEAKESMRKRFRAISGYMRISDEVSNQYNALGTRFLEYVVEKELACGPAPQTDQATQEKCKVVAREVADLFPVVWKRFLDHTKLNDAIGRQ
ncbi:unnamed protein product [Hyaloperonospora brassicae]|uniref:DUF7920 domain-containing protein n=1 Tax=Hyaloperonospora brassicae TaxID=162125 RepID=A0AAV0TSZ8_HYABA|nr:unnamed protein product [Hyaloperonospora brassicae]